MNKVQETQRSEICGDAEIIPVSLTIVGASDKMKSVRALSSAVRAFGLHPKGRPFKSDSAHHPCATPFSGDVVQLVRTLPCHGRGREFESRRPRHSFQRSCFNFGQTIEDAKRPRVAALSRPFCALFFCYMAAASCVVEPNDSEVSEEKTNDSTAACASCFAGLIAWV
jgi:hypothetical protein